MSLETANGAISSAGRSVEQIHPDHLPLFRSISARHDVAQGLDERCEICKHLTLQHLERADDPDLLRLSSLSIPTSHIKRNVWRCLVCRLLARYCFARYGAQPSSYELERAVGVQPDPNGMRRLLVDKNFQVPFSEGTDGDESGHDTNVKILPIASGYKYNNTGLDKLQASLSNCGRFNSPRIDLSTVELWLGHYGGKYKNSNNDLQWMHPKEDHVFWTIDVPNKRLRQTSCKDRYIALGYLLDSSTVSPFVDTAEEFFALIDKGTSLEAALKNQPRTIADAMLVVLEIGENLLWVDALCVPPSSTHRAAHTAIMDQIHSSAALTIVVANGENADWGLSGVASGTPALDQRVEGMGQSLTLAVELPQTIDAVTKAPWNNRGWTYPERLLSKRLLIFVDPAVVLQSRSLWAIESVELCDKNESSIWQQAPKLSVDRVTLKESTQYSRLFKMQGDELFDDSYFWEYATVVEEHSKRNLTLDSDMLAAFSGLSRGFAWAWKTDLLWGLPESRIDSVLLWEKDFSSDRNPHFRRRRPTSVRFPSWTWGGWKGAVRYQTVAFDPTKVEYTRPCVGWFALKNGKLNLLGPASFQMPKDAIRHPNPPIHYGVEEAGLYLKAISVAHHVPTDFCFTNQMLYGYTTVAPIVHFIDYLVGTTAMRLARVPRDTAYTKRGGKLGRSVQFRNHNHEIIGGAELNGDEYYDKDEIDLILLSERRRIDKLKSTETSLGYRVMLVKWDGGGRTATRVGMGRVDQRVWWNASPTWREVVLT